VEPSARTPRVRSHQSRAIDSGPSRPVPPVEGDAPSRAGREPRGSRQAGHHTTHALRTRSSRQAGRRVRTDSASASTPKRIRGKPPSRPVPPKWSHPLGPLASGPTKAGPSTRVPRVQSHRSGAIRSGPSRPVPPKQGHRLGPLASSPTEVEPSAQVPSIRPYKVGPSSRVFAAAPTEVIAAPKVGRGASSPWASPGSRAREPAPRPKSRHASLGVGLFFRA